MPSTPQDEKFTFTADGKTYPLPKIDEKAITGIPGEITYNAVMAPDDEMAQMRLAFATLEACKPAPKSMAALKSLGTTEMLEVVFKWMGESGGSSD